MTAAENIKFLFSQLTGRLYIPDEIRNTTEKKVLHLSDTPTSLYGAISTLIATIKPDIIIHTGDLVDDIKLEYNPGKLSLYSRMVGTFINILEGSSAEKIYIIPGNHDNIDIINSYIDHAQLLTEGETVRIENVTIGLAHRMKRLPANARYYLYGHNFRSPKTKNGAVYLNGMNNINVILLPSERVVKINYPWGVNQGRGLNECILPNSI